MGEVLPLLHYQSLTFSCLLEKAFTLVVICLKTSSGKREEKNTYFDTGRFLGLFVDAFVNGSYLGPINVLLLINMVFSHFRGKLQKVEILVRSKG